MITHPPHKYFTILLLAILGIGAQTFAQLPAKILLPSQEVLDVKLYPRKAGTSIVQLEIEGAEGIRTIDLSEIEQIQFDLSSLQVDTVTQLYYMGQYEDTIKALAGRINPYFTYLDQEANSNEVIQMFVKALYKTENYKTVFAATNEIEKYASKGEMRRFADMYKALSFLQQGDLEKFEPFRNMFAETKYDDPLAPAIWYGQAKLAILDDNWKEANTALAKIITEFPMETDWSGESLYLSATYHHSRTNLVVANQICQEIQIVVPLTEWPEKAAELEEKIKVDAEERGVELVDFGGIREGEEEVGDAKIDYKERQRQLKEEEAQRLRDQLDQNDE